MSTLAVAIPTYNGRHLLEQTLPSFANQTRAPDRLIVVDDGSSDGTVEWLATEWPQVEVIATPTNRGITAALNVCLSAAGSADYVGLFNNDVELAPTALAELCRALDDDPGAAAGGPKMLNYYRRDVIDGAGDIYCWTGTGHRRGHGETDAGQFDRAERIFGVCGGAAVFRSSALAEVGLLDESFFAYYEDVDWSLRANALGRYSIYAPSSVVYHMSSATTGYGMNEFSSYHAWRNAIWVVAKTCTTGEVLVHLPWLLMTQVWNVGLAVRHGLLRTLVRAWRDSLTELPRLRRERRRRPPGVKLILPFSPRRPTWGQ